MVKKVLDKRFLFIFIISITTLIVLIIGVIVFTKDNNKVFAKEGYILDLTSSNDERYYFNDNTAYKKNLSDNIVFATKDDEKVAVNSDSFVHYLDGSLSFLSNGAILDLDTINESVVNYYNISSKSIVQATNDGYNINTGIGSINLHNFIGRISDNKYIVVGDNLLLKIANSENSVSGNYFEFCYVDNGIVNISNNEVKYQVTAEGTEFVVGDIKISLQDKKITNKDKNVLSLTAITIDGEENIEVLEDNNNQDNSDNGNNNNAGNNNEQAGNNAGSNQEVDNNSKKEVKDENNNTFISVKNMDITSTSIGLVVNVVSDNINNKYQLSMINTLTGKKVYETEFSGIGEVILPTRYSLTPDTNYLVTIEDDEKGYYQGLIKTASLGVEFTKLYATSSSLTYDISISEDSDVRSMMLRLYQYDEDSGEYKVVRDVGNNSKSMIVNQSGIYTFDNLESNTAYVAVCEDFTLGNLNYSGTYNISLSDKTLKDITNSDIIPKVDIDSTKSTFTLSLDGIKDKEKSITKYTYYVYKADDYINGNLSSPAIEPIEKTSATDVTINVAPAGETHKGMLENGVNYVYKAVIEYYDNEKYGEFETSYSSEFLISGLPTLELIQDEESTTYKKIKAKLNLIDNSCTVPFSGRECLDETNDIKVTITDKHDNIVFNQNISFIKMDNSYYYDIELDNLEEDSTYKVKVVAGKINMRDGKKVISPYTFTFTNGDNYLVTKSLSDLQAKFSDNGSNRDKVVNSNVKFINPYGEDEEENVKKTAETIKSVVIKLYKGDVSSSINAASPLGVKVINESSEGELKQLLYDEDGKGINISTDETFGLTYNDLVNNDNLAEEYTIEVLAYYEDVSLLPNYMSSKEINVLSNVLVYKVNPIIFMSEIVEPVSVYNTITNKSSGRIFSDINDDTIVGFNITSMFHNLGLQANEMYPESATYYVYRLNNDNSLTKVDFYVYENDKIVKVDKNTGYKFSSIEDYDSSGNSKVSLNIYMKNGTDNDVVDTDMRRGNKYFVSCEIKLDNGDIYPYNVQNVANVYSGLYGIFTDLKNDTGKQLPTYTNYALSSSDNSITYKYTIKDIDNILKLESDNKYIYLAIDSSNNKYKLEKKEDNTYEGEYTISNLNKKDNYKISLNYQSIKSADSSLVEIDSSSFDGIYKASDYNNKYEIINTTHNSVKIKFLYNQEFLSRIVNYKITLKDDNEHEKIYYSDKLTSCGDGDTEKRCMIIDYKELKDAGMQTTDVSNINNIKVKASVYYDSGKIKWSDNNSDMFIFEKIHADTSGNYLVLSNTGSQFGLYNEKSNKLNNKTHYSYQINTNNNRMTLKNLYGKLGTIADFSMRYTITSKGYYSNDASNYFVSKEVLLDEPITDNNKFSFSSITPKVVTSKVEPIINGAYITVNINGFDADSLVKEDDEYYLYIDVWESEDDALSYKSNWTNVLNIDSNTLIKRRVKVKYEEGNANSFRFLIDGVESGKEYYYTVSAFMKEQGYSKGKYTQFIDGNNELSNDTAVYSFISDGSELFSKLQVGYTSSYQDGNPVRKLNSIIDLNSENLNFDVMYVICDTTSANCNQTSYLSNLTDTKEATSKVESSIELNSDFVYGQDYTYNIYGVYELKDEEGTVTDHGYLLLNPDNNSVYINALKQPSFVMTRKANLVDSDYQIETGIKLTDSDKTMKDGKYTYKISCFQIDCLSNAKVYLGEEEITSLNKSTANYEETLSFKIDIMDDIDKVKVTGLKESISYTVMVSGESNRNNYNNVIVDEDISKTYVVYTTNEYGIAFGNVLFRSNADSIIMKFDGGSNFDKVSKVDYQVSLTENINIYVSGSYNTEDKAFETTSEDTSTWRYIIDPEELLTNSNFAKNRKLLEKTFKVRVKFYIFDGDDYQLVFDTLDQTTFYEEGNK